MGYMRNGVWINEQRPTFGGQFVRPDSQFRSFITSDEDGPFPIEKGRYHLYVSLACPWAHRVMIFRELLGLQDFVTASIVEPVIRDSGWEFSDLFPDPLHGASCLHEVYRRSSPVYTGVVSVPVLWDKATSTIVNNESSDIIRMFNTTFRLLSNVAADYYPGELAVQIDAINATIYTKINNGVYRCGFATTQSAYERAVELLFQELDAVEERLANQRYLLGSAITEADWRLFPTLVRFDAVYYGHFKCNIRRLADYENITNYVRDLYQRPGIAQTVNMEHIKRHYYQSHPHINPNGIVPLGPRFSFDGPHDRAKFGRETS